jgi:hypothetical protein
MSQTGVKYENRFTNETTGFAKNATINVTTPRKEKFNATTLTLILKIIISII